MTGRLAAWLAAGPVSGPDAQRAAREELARPEYRRGQPGLLDKVLSWIGDRLGWLFGGSTGGSATVVLIVLLAAVIGLALVRAEPLRRSRGPATDDEADPLRPLDAADHRRRAEQLAATGDHAQALREWLRAAVATIEARGVLDPRPGRTGAGVAREAGSRLPAAASALRAATDAFDSVWFGGRPATPADSDLGRLASEQVRAAPVVAASGAGYAVPR